MKATFLSPLFAAFLGTTMFVAAACSQTTTSDPEGPRNSDEVEADVAPDAKRLLDQVAIAYSKLTAVEFNGEVKVNIDVPGDEQKTNQQFTSSFEFPNKFRHSSGDGLIVGSTGDKAFVFNEKVNSYVWMEAPGEKMPIRDLPRMIPQILQSQNPALLFAMSKDSVMEVAESFGEVTKAPNITVSGKSYPALEFTSAEDHGHIMMAIDPDTHLVRQFIFDFKPALQEGGATNVKTATVSVDYPEIKTKPTFAAEHFAWTPPVNAFDLREPAGARRPPKREADKMKGQPATHFTLNTIQGKEVSIADMKGDVVVLEFWATWCPPCVESLVQLSGMKSANGFKVYAVNVEEDKDRVQTFLELKKITVPVLLDERGDVSKKYNVTSLPQTVVIGKDGRIKQVFQGVAEDTFNKLRQAISAAQREIPKG